MPALEEQVLNEYSRMARNLDQMAKLTQKLSNTQPAALELLRPLERQMGLVLTLFQASIWAVLVQREEEDEARYN